MVRELEKYIKDSLKKGVDENLLRYNLQAAGWTNEQINQGIQKATRTTNTPFIAIIILATIVIFGGSFIFLLSNFENAATPTQGYTQMQSCDTLPNGDSKISCYEEKVKTSYNCNDIVSQTERLYCLRALENYYLTQV